MTGTWTRRRLVVTIALGALTTLLAGTASAGPLDPQFKTQRTYFHCSGPTKLGNANLVAANSIPSWDTTPPPGSVSTGAGCGTADFNGVLVVVDPQENPTDGVWRGKFTGNLDSLTVHVHCICLGTAKLDNAATIGVRLSIDGQPMTGDGTASHDVTAVPMNSDVTQLYEFSVTGLGFTEPNVDVDGDGVGDNPFGKAEHQITLTLEGYDAGTNTWGMWVYDTTEVPSGITFNPTTLAATVIEAEGSGE